MKSPELHYCVCCEEFHPSYFMEGDLCLDCADLLSAQRDRDRRLASAFNEVAGSADRVYGKGEDDHE